MSQPQTGTVTLLYQDLWDKMVIHEEWKLRTINLARKILQNKAKYEQVAHTANPRMPWYFVGIIHQLECSGSFNLHLHNGDPLSARTVHVPKGRPLTGKPPFTWNESALDALQLEGFNKIESWSLPEMLYQFEKYNGLGYRSKGINSPYIWSGTTYYTMGKYVADNHYDPKAVSEQVGCAPLLRYVTDKTLGIAI